MHREDLSGMPSSLLGKTPGVGDWGGRTPRMEGSGSRILETVLWDGRVLFQGDWEGRTPGAGG